MDKNFDAIVNPESDESLEQGIERAGMHHAAAKLIDPEWTTPRCYHIHSLIQYVASGIIAADPYFHNYSLPPDFVEVVNHIASRLVEAPPPGTGDEEIRYVSLIDMEVWLRRELMADDHFVAWNDAPGEVFITRDSAVPEYRQFIDLDAALRNIVVIMRDATRRNDAFEAAFEARHPKKGEE